MRYGFINNFSQALAADLAAGATTMTLDGGGADLSAASAALIYPLTLIQKDANGNEIGWEIVHVTGQTNNDLTIVREQEGTTALSPWPSGTAVEMRITAGTLGASVFTVGSNTVGLAASITGATNAVALGPSASVSANSGVALGDNATASGAFGFALGPYATASGEDTIAIGYATASGLESIAVGEGSFTDASHGHAFGAYSIATATDALTLGYEARVYAAGGIGIGKGIRVDLPGGYRAAGVPYLSASPLDGVFTGAGPAVAYHASPAVVLQTEALDLTNAAAVVTLALPTGARLFIDSIDVIINGSNAPGGTPQITVGPDDVTPAAYLAATTVSKTAVGERQTHTPLVRDGVTSLRVAVSTAGTGTTYTAKVVFRGYVMEL